MLDLHIQLTFWILAAPVLLQYLLHELLAVDHLVVSFLFVELIALPDESSMLVVLMAWDPVLGPDTEHQERVLLQVVIVKNSRRFVPVGVAIQLGLHLLLFITLLVIGVDLIHSRLSFHEVQVRQL